MRLRPTQLAGLLLDIAGIGMMIASMPDAGPLLWAGLGTVAVGSWLVTRGNPKPAPSAAAPVRKPKVGWLPEPELRQTIPRKTAMNPIARISLVSWLLMLSVGGWIAYDRVLTLNPPPSFYQMVSELGETASGSIHRKAIREASSGPETYYYFYYNFLDASGAGIRASTIVTGRIYERYREGDSIDVVFLPDDPLSHYLPQITRSPSSTRGLLMVAVIVVFFGWILETMRRRHRRLVRTGQAIPGTVENVRRRGARTAYSVRFKADGKEAVLKGSERGPRRSNGDTATVLVDPATPGDAVVYQQGLYRATRG